MPDNFKPLTPEQCLYQDLLAAVQTAEGADIHFDEIRGMIIGWLDEMDPRQLYEPPLVAGTEPNPDREIY